MRAVYAESINPEDPLTGLVVGERPDPTPEDGWTRVAVKAASLNHHDLWTLARCGHQGRAAADDPGLRRRRHRRVDRRRGGRPLGHQRRRLARRRHPRSRAARCCRRSTRARWPSTWSCPSATSCPKPAELSCGEAACLSTAWLTAYRMLFTQARAAAGADRSRAGRDRAASRRRASRWRARRGCASTLRHAPRTSRPRALELGAHEAFASGARLPERVDAVMETVGEATWSHSLKSLKPGGRHRRCPARRRARRRRPT